MIWSVRMPLCCAGLVLLPLAGACADGPSFAELLARAHAESAAGHEWAPPGDNVSETFMRMVNLLPQATPAQLADFQAMLRTQQRALGKGAKPLPDNRGNASAANSPSAPPQTAPQEAAAPRKGETHAAAPDKTNRTQPAEAAADVPHSVTLAGEADRSVPAHSSAEAALSIPIRPTSDGHDSADAGMAPTRTYAEREMPPAPEPGTAALPSGGRNSGSVSDATPVPAAAVPATPKPDSTRSQPSDRPFTQSVPQAHDSAPSTITRRDVPRTASPAIPPAMVADLFARGQVAETRGDISGARRYYESAANQGLAAAARALARLYDPAYLREKAIGGIAADPAQAELWNQRAAALDHKPSHALSQALSAR